MSEPDLPRDPSQEFHLDSDDAARAAYFAAAEILDSPREESFDRIANLAARVMDAPIALVSLADTNRMWFKACVGMEATEAPRELAFCDHAIRASQTLIIEDAATDPRFCDNPLVTGPPYVRFYAGAQLRTDTGVVLGTLCVLDHKPRNPDPATVSALGDLTRGVVVELELRRVNAALRDQVARQAELTRALDHDRRRLEDFLAATSDMLWETDARLEVTSVGGSQLLQPAAETMIGRPLVDVARAAGLDAAATGRLEQDIAARLPFRTLEFSRLAGDRVLWLEASAKPVFGPDGAFMGYRGVTRDITGRKRREELVRKLAEEDPLTGLPNRRMFDTRLETLISTHKSGAVLLLDIDHFKQVNDTYGHDVGDTLVRAIGARISAQLRSGDTVARIGGDEFAVVLEGVRERGVRSIARRILKSAGMPFEVAGRTISASISIGAVLVPRDANEPPDAMRLADQALYRAKHAGRGRYDLYEGFATTAAGA